MEGLGLGLLFVVLWLCGIFIVWMAAGMTFCHQWWFPLGLWIHKAHVIGRYFGGKMCIWRILRRHSFGCRIQMPWKQNVLAFSTNFHFPLGQLRLLLFGESIIRWWFTCITGYVRTTTTFNHRPYSPLRKWCWVQFHSASNMVTSSKRGIWSCR